MVQQAGRQSGGEAYYFRFADDFLACFQYKEDAESFQRRLADRLAGFGLQLAEEKTHCIEFGRFARENAYKRSEKPKEFTFLEFTHYCGKTKEGYFKVKRRYYAITDNLERCSYYVYRTKRILFKWLNRKSQRRAYTWENFDQALAWVEWPKPRVRKDLNPCRRAEVY